MENDQAVTYLGQTNFRGKETKFGIKAVDRTKHMYVIGKSGTGKSTFLENMAVQDIQAGRGIGFLDPHGGSADKLLEFIPDERRQDVIYFAPFDTDYPISFNVMEDVGPDKRHLVADGLLSAFKKIWVDSFSARMEHILRNTLLALLEVPGSTLLGVNRMLSDKDFRKWVVAQIKDDSVRSFWVDEYGKWDQKYATEAGAAIQNKIGQFTSNPIVRNIIGQPKSSFDFREAMDSRKILILNLSKGRMGDENAALVGAMLITKIYLAAMSRADLTSSEMARMPSFSFYADEFQNFANDSFANILSEARKYKLALTLAHQYVEQLPETLQSAIKGNMGSMIVFRVGATDAETFEKEFAPTFLAEDFTNLGFGQMYLRIAIDGVGSKPFSAKSLYPIQPLPNGDELRRSIISESRERYAASRADVEGVISEWYHRSFLPERPQRAPGDGPAVGSGDPFLDFEAKKPAADKGVFRASEPFQQRTIQRPTQTPSMDPARSPQAPLGQVAQGNQQAPRTAAAPTAPRPVQATQPAPVVQAKPIPTPAPKAPEAPKDEIHISDTLGSLLDQMEFGVAAEPTIKAEPIVTPVPKPEVTIPKIVRLPAQEPTHPSTSSGQVNQLPQSTAPFVIPSRPQPYSPKPIAQSNSTETPSLNSASAAHSKAAPVESRDALRSVLFEAMRNIEPVPVKPAEEPKPVTPEPIPEPVVETTSAPVRPVTVNDFRPKAVKEVPEDILRKVLE